MRKLLLVLALSSILGCVKGDGVYQLQQHSYFVGVALSTHKLITTIHPPHVGQRMWLRIRNKWTAVKVTKVEGELVILESLDGSSLDIKPGDSGSPVFNEHGGAPAAIIRGYRERKRFTVQGGGSITYTPPKKDK